MQNTRTHRELQMEETKSNSGFHFDIGRRTTIRSGLRTVFSSPWFEADSCYRFHCDIFWEEDYSLCFCLLEASSEERAVELGRLAPFIEHRLCLRDMLHQVLRSTSCHRHLHRYHSTTRSSSGPEVHNHTHLYHCLRRLRFPSIFTRFLFSLTIHS